MIAASKGEGNGNGLFDGFTAGGIEIEDHPVRALERTFPRRPGVHGQGAEMGEAPLIVIVSEMAEAMKAAPKPATKAEVLRAGWV